MADYNCSACDELRADAPNLIVNGITNTECTSLKNNTGLSPSSGNDNCEDLDNLNDCLVGNMSAELESFDVCEWKPFMRKFVPNVWTVLKALICSECGIWPRLEALCRSIDNLLALIRGNAPKNHTGEWTDSFKAKVTMEIIPDGPTPSISNFKPTFQADVLSGAGCSTSKKLGRFFPWWVYTDDIYPRYFVWGIKDTEVLSIGEVIGTIPMSAVVGQGDMTEARWKDNLRVSGQYTWGYIGNAELIVATRGNVIIDGIEFNPDLRPYGQNTCVLSVYALVGSPSGTVTGVYAGGITKEIRSYDA